MPKTRAKKHGIVEDLSAKIGRAKSLVFVSFNKLTVSENETLRKALKKEGSEYITAKKTLLKISLKNNNLDGQNVESFNGQMAAVLGYEDEVAPARIVDEFKKDKEKSEKIQFLGGILEGRFIGAAEVTALAKLPSREELYAKLVGSINAPVSGFVNVLAGNLRQLVGVLKAIEEKKS